VLLDSSSLPDDGEVSFVSLGPEDYQSVLDAGQVLHERGWVKPYTLNEQVSAWQSMVESVEDGYDLTIDDYVNDLDVRGWLNEARPLLTGPVRQSLDDRPAVLDAHFQRATTTSSRQMPGAGPEWWYRLPKVLVGDLREDVERLSLLQAE
jgi:hypothetical protein